MIVRTTNSAKCLRSTVRSRSTSAHSAARLATNVERVGVTEIPGAGASAIRGVVPGVAVTREAPCPSA